MFKSLVYKTNLTEHSPAGSTNNLKDVKMTRVDLSDSLAADMDKALNSEENKEMFSSSSVLEKLAFHRVADEGKLVSEVEEELKKQGLQKTASSEEAPKQKTASDIASSILKVSEELEEAGFERLAALSIVLAEKLVAEAKEKSKSKSSKKDEKSSKSDKSSKKKMSMKERMEKMRQMQKGKKKSKKSALEVELEKQGQDMHQPPPQNLKPDSPKPAHLSEVDTVLNALPANLKKIRLQQTDPDTFSVNPGQAVQAVTKVVQQLQQAGQLPWQKKYHIMPA